MYYPVGAVAPNPEYCSPANVPPGCRVIKGVAVPRTDERRRWYNEVQRQANRAMYGWRNPIAIDGRIGKDVVAACKSAAAHMAAKAGDNLHMMLVAGESKYLADATMEKVAATPWKYADILKKFGDALEAPATVEPAAKPSKAPSSTVAATAPAPTPESPTPESPPPGSPAAKIKLTDPLVLGAIGVVALLLFTGDKGKASQTPRKRA